MASDTSDNEDRTDATHEPRECMPCRGSGQVISNLGGTPNMIACPWCAGAGVRVPDTDAQARWPREDVAAEGSQAPAEDAPAPAAEPSAPRA